MKKTFAFFAKYEDQLVNCVKVENQFFINYGPKIVISPMNRIRKVEINPTEQCVRFYFDIGKELKTDSCITFPYNIGENNIFQELADSFVKENKKAAKFKISLFPDTWTSSHIVIVNCEKLIKEIPVKKDIVSVFIVPNNIKLKQKLMKHKNCLRRLISKLKKFDEYIKYQGEVLPIKKYVIATKRNKTDVFKFSKIIEDAAESIR